MQPPPPSPVLQHADIDGEPNADALLDGFLRYVEALGIELYPAQEEAILEIFAGNNVILNTPTGSGKSLVALAVHFAAIARGERAFYTAPIKALVSEKFFDLCEALGPDNVGMMTGDATINHDAKIICCTAEILSNMALREGENAKVDYVVMDEFHFYSDRDRGVAWQIPLLTLPRATFVLMSATLGDTALFETSIEELTGVPVSLVKSTTRPVPLDFFYAQTPLHRTIEDLVAEGKSPVYVVHFTQRSATELAQDLMSIDFLSKDSKQEIKSKLGHFRFDTPFGKELKRYVHHGVGVHHAGMLPKYRRMVERLAQSGLLKIICGTDTLGVGVNVPIRTVLFTKLCKYDGSGTNILSARDFHQIAGRAGRKGFDDMGSVVAQAPEHVIQNKHMRDKLANDPKRLRKFKPRKPPDRGYVAWDESAFLRLQSTQPEPLTSKFEVSQSMVLNMLLRPSGGCTSLKQLIRRSHDRRHDQRNHARKAIAIIRSLKESGVLAVRDGEIGVSQDLQSDFSLNQALSLFVVEAIDVLDPEESGYAHDVLTLVESTLENPTVVLLRQQDALKTRALNEMKAEGIEYDERMAELEKIEYPKPNADFLYATFNIFSKHHAWVGSDVLRPKSIARDLHERGASFVEYVKEYGLQRSEGVLLRYLSNCYKALVQNVPEVAKTDALLDLTESLGWAVRQVDASLISEWEALANPEVSSAEPRLSTQAADIRVTQDRKGFEILVRNRIWALVRALAFRNHDKAVVLLQQSDPRRTWKAEELRAQMASYWDEYESLDVGPDARSSREVEFEYGPSQWKVWQTLVDPRHDRVWRAHFEVDIAGSTEANAPIFTLIEIASR